MEEECRPGGWRRGANEKKVNHRDSDCDQGLKKDAGKKEVIEEMGEKSRKNQAGVTSAKGHRPDYEKTIWGSSKTYCNRGRRA